MRHLVVGPALILLLACSSVSAGEAPPSTESDSTPKVQNRPSPTQGHAKKNKQISSTRSRSALSSLPLSSAEAYAAEHSADLPVSSAAKQASPTTGSWTGFYVGAGIGAGRQ